MKVSAVGRQAPRPRPARNRRIVNWATFWANATARVSTENSAMLLIRAIRRPKRSVSGPMATAPMPTPTRPTVEAMVSAESVKPEGAGLLQGRDDRADDDEVEAVEGDRRSSTAGPARSRVAVVRGPTSGR